MSALILGRGAWAACLATVIIGSLLPAESGPIRELASFGVSDKIEHGAAYAALSALIPFAFDGRRARQLFLASLGLVCLGAVLEILQALVPGRSPDFSDEAANTTGVLLGALGGWLARRAWRAVGD